VCEEKVGERIGVWAAYAEAGEGALLQNGRPACMWWEAVRVRAVSVCVCVCVCDDAFLGRVRGSDSGERRVVRTGRGRTRARVCFVCGVASGRAHSRVSGGLGGRPV
jgi:hypothetical protein